VLAAVVITGGLAALIVLAVPSRDVAAALEGFDPLWLAPMLASYFATYVCRAARFRGLGVPLSLATLSGVSAIHQFMNRIMPLRTGELAFPVLVRRLCGTNLVEGLTLVLLVHLLDLAAVALAFLAALLAVPGARSAIGPVGTALVAASLPALLVGYLVLPSLGSRVAGRLALRLRDRRPRWAERLEHAATALASVRTVSRRAFVAAVVWTALQWLATFAFFWASLAAVGLSLGPADVIVGSSAAIVAGVAPVAGIGSFGTLEGGWAAGFVLVGLPAGAAVASALVMSGTSFGFALVLAGIAWIWLSRRRSSARDPR